MTASPLDIRVQDIDHCGLVAGMIDEMNLVEQINRLLGTHPLDALFVADAAWYAAENLQQMNQLRWVSSVPCTLAAAKFLLENTCQEAFVGLTQAA